MSIKTELALVQRYAWHRRQHAAWDRWSNFIYRATILADVQAQAQRCANEQQLDPASFEDYCIARWYNHHTTQVIEGLWATHGRVRREPNARHHERDFWIDRQPFDLKTTFPPHHLRGATLRAWLNNPLAALRWYYTEQSSARFHAAPRLFLVLVDEQKGEMRWQNKRQFAILQQAITIYLDANTACYPAISFTHNGANHTAPAAELLCVQFGEPCRVRWWRWGTEESGSGERGLGSGQAELVEREL